MDGKIKVSRGLDLPLTGGPRQEITGQKKTSRVGVLGPDFKGMKPTLLVKEGDQVKIGQKLFEDKKIPGIFFTSPGSGKIVEINRGHRRVFQSMVIELDGTEERITFDSFKRGPASSFKLEDVKGLLLESGMWTALRTRPYSKTPSPDTRPHSLFINCMDTNPLALDSKVLLSQYDEDFKFGLEVLSTLPIKGTYVCKDEKTPLKSCQGKNIEVKSFAGVHPAGNVGTHMHFLDPVGDKKVNWHLGFQDVIAVGKLFSTGQLWIERVISLCGPQVKNPRLIKVPLGANCLELLEGEIEDGEYRAISGSAVYGRKCWGCFSYLGRFSQQLTVIREGGDREFLGWHMPGLDKFSLKPVFLSKLFSSKRFSLTTNKNGSYRAMVPIGMFEKVMPLDILPTQLLKSLITKNTEQAQLLGCLELDEEDLALCTLVDPGKLDFGPILRENLNIIEKEG